MRPYAAILACVAASLPLTAAVFADEAYRTDYHHALLGLPEQHTTFFHRPQAAGKATLLYTLSEKAILGAVNPKDGIIVWRQSLGSTSDPSPRFLRAGEDESVVVSAMGQEVRAWDALSGKLVWGNEFGDGIATDLEVLEAVGDAEAKARKDTLVLFGRESHGTVRRLRGETGEVVWEFHDKSGDVPFQLSSSATSVYLIALHPAGKGAFKIRVTTLDPVTGRQTGQYTLSSESDVSGPSSILHVGANSASPVIAWVDKAHKSLKINIIGSKHVVSHNIANPTGDEITKVVLHAPHLTKSLPHFLVHYETVQDHWAEVFHIDLKSSTASSAYKLPKTAGKGSFSTSTQDANVYFTRNTETEIILVSSASHGILERWAAPKRVAPALEDYPPIFAVSEVVPRSPHAYAVRSAVLHSNGDWHLVRNGISGWTRSEGLAGVVAAEWAELSEEETLARELEEEGHENILKAYFSRTRRHVRDLQHLPSWLQSFPQRVISGIFGDPSKKPADTALHRDSFGFRKLVILATEHGRLYALDTGRQGAIVWRIQVVKDLGPGALWDVRGIFVDNRHGTVTVKGARGDSITVKTFSGEVLSFSPATTPIEGATLIETASGEQVILDIYAGGRLSDVEAGHAPKSNATVIVRGDDNTVRGVRFLPSGSKASDALVATTVWSFTPEPGFTITSLATRPIHDPIASIGRVLGDRSVMYKYLNPSLLLITTVSSTTNTLSLHLLDSVSGSILHTITHSSVDTSVPVPAAMSENWFAYSYFSSPSASSSSSKGHHLVISELYSSSLPNDRGLLSNSSFTTSPPHLVSQSFVLPSPPSILAVTSTSQGITARSLLLYLPQSAAILSLPKYILDPRRPVDRDPTSQEVEEGLIRYQPVIDLDPQSVLSHLREVLGVKGVMCSPAVLESTSLVLAWGAVDVFGTRVSPSMAFDVLGSGFGRGQLILTVLGLAVGVVVLAPVIRRKQIDAGWKS